MKLFGWSRESYDAAYWRNAYETLVEQTGRDLNDGFGIDPRKPAHFGRSGVPPGWSDEKAYSVWRIQGLMEAVNRWRDRATAAEAENERLTEVIEDMAEHAAGDDL